MSSLPPPRGNRVRITNPLVAAAPRVPRSIRQEITESTTLGELYVESLVRSQLRAAITVVVTVLLLIGSLPLVFIVFENVRSGHVWGIGLPWLIVGVGVYPLLVAVAWLFVRQAERAENEFAAIVEHRDTSA